MIKKLLRSPARIALALAILLSLPMSLRQIARPDQPDFQVYLTAAQLVREHRGAVIYNEADSGRDPQLQFASAHSLFLATALRKGITGVRLYVYPPTLADAIVPLTYLSLNHACDAWLAFNIVAVFLTAWLFAWLVGHPLRSLQFLWIFVVVLMFRANIWAMYWGQVSVLLLLLWTAGIVLYARGFTRLSAAMLALATAIKLTPLLVLLPLLMWRDWRAVRWFTASLAACALLICVINGPATLADFALHVVPSMSGGIASVQNISLPAAVELFYAGLHGADAHSTSVAVPHIAVTMGKAAAFAVFLAAAFAVFRLRDLAGRLDRATVLAMIALLSICIAPVSWRHAYCLALPALFFIWRDALRREPSRLALAFLVFCTIECSFVFDSVLTKITSGPAMASIALLAPTCGIALVFYALRALPVAPDGSEPAGNP